MTPVSNTPAPIAADPSRATGNTGVKQQSKPSLLWLIVPIFGWIYYAFASSRSPTTSDMKGKVSKDARANAGCLRVFSKFFGRSSEKVNIKNLKEVKTFLESATSLSDIRGAGRFIEEKILSKKSQECEITLKEGNGSSKKDEWDVRTRWSIFSKDSKQVLEMTGMPQRWSATLEALEALRIITNEHTFALVCNNDEEKAAVDTYNSYAAVLVGASMISPEGKKLSSENVASINNAFKEREDAPIELHPDNKVVMYYRLPKGTLKQTYAIRSFKNNVLRYNVERELVKGYPKWQDNKQGASEGVAS